MWLSVTSCMHRTWACFGPFGSLFSIFNFTCNTHKPHVKHYYFYSIILFKGASEIKYIYTLIKTWTPPLIKALILRKVITAYVQFTCALLRTHLLHGVILFFSLVCMAQTLKSLNFAGEGKSIVYLHETKQSSTIFVELWFKVTQQQEFC